MNFLKNYPPLGIRNGQYNSPYTSGQQPQQNQPTIQQGQPLALQGPGTLPNKGLHSLQMGTSSASAYGEAFGNVGNQFLEAQNELQSAANQFKEDVAAAHKELGTVDTQVDKLYSEILEKEGVTVAVGRPGGPTGENGSISQGPFRTEAEYEIPYSVWDDLWKAFHDPSDPRHEEMKNSPWRMGSYKDEQGVEHLYVDPNGYGKELHELFINMPEQIKQGAYAKVAEQWSKASQELAEQETEGLSKLGGYSNQLALAGNQLGGLYSSMNVDLPREFSDTGIGAGERSQSRNRQTGFSVLGG